MICLNPMLVLIFFFNDTATTEIYTLSLHDALPISFRDRWCLGIQRSQRRARGRRLCGWEDRKSTRLNSSHQIISYAVFCLKKKNPAKMTQNWPHTRTRVDSSKPRPITARTSAIPEL